MSPTALSDRPISRRISRVRPDTLPVSRSRGVLVSVERGNMVYSAVIHPFPCPRRNGGTHSSRLAVHTTLVSPTSMRAEPSGKTRKDGVMVTFSGLVVWSAVYSEHGVVASLPALSALQVSLTPARLLFYGLGCGYSQRVLVMTNSTARPRIKYGAGTEHVEGIEREPHRRCIPAQMVRQAHHER